MTDHKDRSPDFSDLRRRAEERLKTEAVLPEELSPAEVGRLIRELKVSQIELEIQNEELRLTQGRLEESRRRCADLYDFSPVGYLTLDPEGRIAEANLTAAKFLGVGKERLTGRFFSHFLEEADRLAFRRLITNTRFEPGKQGEFRLQGGNGGGRTVLLDIFLTEDAQGREQRRIAMTDLTELKRTQEELRLHKEDLEDLVARRVVELIEVNYQLRQSNEKLQAVIDYSPLAVIHLDNQGRVLGWNPAAERTFGWRAAEVVGGPLPIVPEEKQEESAAIIRRTLQGEHFTGLELRRQRKDGVWIDVSVSVAPVRDEQGKVSGLVGIGEDVTARKRAEEALKTQARILESMAEGVTVTDSRGNILYTNPAFDTMFGYEPGELLSRHSNILNHYPPEENTRVVKEILQAVDTIGVWSGEFHNRRKDGSLFLTAARISALEAGGKKLFISVQEDITERKRYEEEIRRLASFPGLNPHPVMEIDEHGAVVYANPAAWNLVEKLQLPEGIKALVPPGLKKLFKEVRRGAPRFHAFDLKLKDFTFSVSVHFPHDLPTARLYALDITERQRAEEVLRRQAELLDLAHDAILVRDLQGRITFWNQGAAGLYGFTPEEALGQRTHELLQTAFPVPLADIEAQILKEGCWQGELRQTTKDGRRLVISSSRTLGRDAEGRPQSILVINTDITERQRAEEALRESEARFRKIFENAATGIAIVDWEGRFQQCNPAYCALLGYTEEELRRMNFASLIHPEEREGNLSELRLLKAGELPYFETESRYVRKDGQPVWVHKFVSVLTDSTGKPAYLVGLVTDISDRKLAEQALRESEARERARAAELQGLFDAVPAFVSLAHDPEGRRITGNSLAYEFLGLPVGGNISLSAPKEERPRNFRVMKDGLEIPPEELPVQIAARGEAVRNYEFDLVFTDGTRRSLFGNAIPLRDDSGNPRGAVTAFIDITARQRTEEALRERTERYELVVAGAHAGIWDWDVLNHRVFFSPHWKSLHGFAEDETVDRPENWSESIHPDDAPRVFTALQEHFAGSTPVFAEEYRIICRDGSIKWILDRGITQRDAAGRVVRMAGSETDITARKRGEAELARQKELLQAIIDNIPVMLAIYDPDLKTFRLNQELHKVLGWTEENLPADDPLALFYPDPEYREQVRQYMQSLEPGWRDFRVTAKDGGSVDSTWANIRLTDDTFIGIGVDIRERKRAEEALRESEARYRAVGELIPYGIWTANPHGGLEFISKSFLEMTGKTLEECQRYGWLYLLPDEDIESTLADWQHFLKTGSFWDYEHKIRSKDGDYRTILSRGVPLADSEGRITSWVGINLDITERKVMEEGLRRARDELESRVEERTRELQLAYDSLRSEMKKHQRTADRLRESEARFSAFMRHLPGIAVMRDTQGRYLFANDTWERLVGKTKQDWQGKTAAEIWPADLAQEFSALNRHILTTGQSLETVHEVDLTDGRRVYLTYNFPILDNQGLPYMVGAIGTDITERRQAEEALKKNEAMLRLILDTLPVGVWVADKDGRIVQSNPAARHIWGGARDVGIEHYGEYKGWWADTGQRLAPQDWSLARAVQKGETSLGEIIHIEGFDGSRKTILNSAAPLFGENREILGAIAVNEDITDLRRAEKVMLQQARQVEAFFAHNLNPLVFLDPEFNFLRVNEAYARACQREVQEFIGRNHFEFFPDAENEAIFRGVVETKSSYVALDSPFKFTDHPEWGLTYWDWTLAPILDEAGQVDFLVFSLNDVTERKRAELDAGRQNALIAGINGIFREALVCESEEELAATCLAVAEELTGSMFGFIDELNEAGNLDALAFSDASLEQCRLASVGDPSSLHDVKARGLLAKSIETGEPIIANDPAAHLDAVGLPPDHPPLTAYLGVPLKHGDKVIGLLRLGNKDGGYDHRDLEDMENLGGAIVEAWMRKRAETTARRHAAVVAGINRIFREALTCETLEDLGRACLVVAEELSGSRFGFIDLVNAEGSLDLMAVSDSGRQACRQAGKKKFKPPPHVPVRGIYRSVIEAGTSLIANDPASHPDWRGLPKGHPALTSYLGVPLKQGRRVLGQIGLGNRESGYGQRELETVEALAVPIAEAFLHKQAADGLQESEESLHFLAGQLLEVQETERRRLSRELHDGLGQTLLVLKFKLSSINAELSPAKREVRLECLETLRYMDDLINEVRHLSRDLSPGPLEELGLTAALKYLCDESRKHYKILSQSIRIDEVDGIFEPLVDNNIYRIFQETLANVGKHAEATRISVTVKKQANRVSFTVRDNGRGFKVSEALARQPDERGIGLASMQERVRMMGGTMNIWSREGKGTRITFTVPKKPE